MAGLPPERISRFLTYLLRHRPQEYPLVFDRRGFADWRDVVELVQERFYDVTEDDIRAVVTDAQKQRFELQDHREFRGLADFMFDDVAGDLNRQR